MEPEQVGESKNYSKAQWFRALSWDEEDRISVLVSINIEEC